MLVIIGIKVDNAITGTYVCLFRFCFCIDAGSAYADGSIWCLYTMLGFDDVFIGKKTYRLDGTSQFVTLGYNWVMDLHSSFDFSARYLQSDAADVGLDYQGLTLLASYFHRFNL